MKVNIPWRNISSATLKGSFGGAVGYLGAHVCEVDPLKTSIINGVASVGAFFLNKLTKNRGFKKRQNLSLPEYAKNPDLRSCSVRRIKRILIEKRTEVLCFYNNYMMSIAVTVAMLAWGVINPSVVLIGGLFLIPTIIFYCKNYVVRKKAYEKIALEIGRIEKEIEKLLVKNRETKTLQIVMGKDKEGVERLKKDIDSLCNVIEGLPSEVQGKTRKDYKRYRDFLAKVQKLQAAMDHELTTIEISITTIGDLKKCCEGVLKAGEAWEKIPRVSRDIALRHLQWEKRAIDAVLSTVANAYQKGLPSVIPSSPLAVANSSV